MLRKNDAGRISVFENDALKYLSESGSGTELPNEKKSRRKANRHRTPDEKAAYHVQMVSETGEPRKLAAERGKITSLGTQRTYRDSIRTMFRAIDSKEIGRPKKIDVEFASDYLLWRTHRVTQKTLDVDRLAMSKVFHLDLPYLISTLKSSLTSRAYTEDQMEMIGEGGCREMILPLRLCFFCGLRAHELFAILPIEEQPASPRRDWWDEQFEGMPSGSIYTVIGKGGLIRPIKLPSVLADELEMSRLSNSKTVKDRKIFYRAHYDLIGGQLLSQKFSVMSKKVLGWSAGLHGLRHSYAQKRMRTLMALGYPFDICLGIVSRELGHYRPDITKTYLR